MNHAITIGGLLLGLGLAGFVITICVGLLMTFAAGMSDAGDDGTGSAGCAVFVAGLIGSILCLIGLLG